jgi:TrmH family RNA methyltransferase
MIKITSVQNDKIKEFYQLHNKKVREIEQRFIVEGYHLIEEAMKKGILQAVLFTNEVDAIDGIENYHVTNEVIQKLSNTKTPQGIIGIVSMQSNVDYISDRYLVLDGIQDPGNLGTIIRSALGFGIETICLGLDCVDLYNEKVIRATQGAMFHITFIKDDIIHMMEQLKLAHVPTYVTTVECAQPIHQLNITNQYAIILGNEGSGVQSEVIHQADHKIYIKTNEQLESLNVGIAASIIMYEFHKQMKG